MNQLDIIILKPCFKMCNKENTEGKKKQKQKCER